jgi:hypothetical protein
MFSRDLLLHKTSVVLELFPCQKVVVLLVGNLKMTFSGMRFMQSFLKICKFVQKLLSGTQTWMDTQT